MTLLEGSQPPTLYLAAGTILVLLSYLLFTSARKDDKQLPPGPPPKPFIGNLLDMPNGAKAQAYYTKLGKQYGPISSLSVFGTTLIVINDYNVAKELTEKRAARYSDRPVMHMLGSLMGLDKAMVLEQPGERFTRLRKISHHQLGSVSSVAKWSKDVDVEVRRYLLRTLEEPAKFMDHLRVQAATVVLRVLYGYEADQHAPDPLIMLGEKFTGAVIKAGVPGEWMVDAMPILKYVPEWLPGASFKRQARIWEELAEQMVWLPFNFTKRELQAGKASPSVVSESLTAGVNSESDIAWAALSMFGGGSDTSLGIMEMFWLAMTLYPDVMEKAQREIDSVIGTTRLVNELDRRQLSYTDALLKEVMRWEPIMEVNIPHCAAEHDEYDGYLIPKGAILLSNTCGFMHDSTIYAEPEHFRPERFLGAKPDMNPFDVVWGHGRRICPGRHLAFLTLWLEVARTLQVFDIRAVPGRVPERKFTWGVIRRPMPFETTTTIRSPEHEALVRSIEKERPAPAQGSKL